MNNTFNQHRAKVLKDARKQAAKGNGNGFDVYTSSTFSWIVTRNWLRQSHQSRKWDLTPKSERPNYLRAPWIRFFGYEP